MAHSSFHSEGSKKAKRPAPTATGLFASAILAVITLLVFYRLQDSGPLSAIKKFNEGARGWSGTEIDQVTVQNLDDPSVRMLAGRAKEFLDNGATLRVTPQQRLPGVTTVLVEYILPDGEVAPMLFVLKWAGDSWKVDADGSVQAMQKAVGT